MKNIIVAMLAFVVISANAAESNQWQSLVHEDRITGEKFNYAISSWSKSETILNFPYTGTKSLLGVVENGDELRAYVKFSDALVPTGGRYKNGQLLYTLRVSVDGKPTTFDFIDDTTGSTLHAIDGDKLIDMIMSANTIKLEVPVYQNHPAYFNYSLKGSAKAISQF